jgi:hypothetical protein
MEIGLYNVFRKAIAFESEFLKNIYQNYRVAFSNEPYEFRKERIENLSIDQKQIYDAIEKLLEVLIKEYLNRALYHGNRLGIELEVLKDSNIKDKDFERVKIYEKYQNIDFSWMNKLLTNLLKNINSEQDFLNIVNHLIYTLDKTNVLKFIHDSDTTIRSIIDFEGGLQGDGNRGVFIQLKESLISFKNSL